MTWFLERLLVTLRWMMVGALPVMLWNFHREIFGYGWALFQGFLASVGIPTIDLPNLSTWISSNGLWPLLASANDWIPIVEAVACLVGYCVLFLALTPIKMVLRRIPGING